MQQVTKKLIDVLKDEIERNRFVDVSKGAEQRYLVSKDRLRTAVDYLCREYYDIVNYVKMNEDPNRVVIKILTKEGENINDIMDFAKKIYEERIT